MRKRVEIMPANTLWIDGDFYVHVNKNMMTIAAGSRQRALPCIVCATPAGGQKCYLIVVTAGILCPRDNSHLNGAGMFCHARCLPASDEDICLAVIRVLSAADH